MLPKKSVFKKKIYGFHCDVYQHVNNARFLELLEEARWEFTSPLKNSKYFEANNLMTIVANINISYKIPLFFKDEIEIVTTISEVGKKSMTFYQEIYKENKSKLCTIAAIKFVIFDKEKQKSIFITDELKKVFGLL